MGCLGMPSLRIRSKLVKMFALVSVVAVAGTVGEAVAERTGLDSAPQTAEETVQRREARAEFQNARGLAARKQYVEALEASRKAVAADGSFGAARSLTGNLLLDVSEGNSGEAEAEFRKAAELSPKDMDARVGMARLKALKGDIEGAVVMLEEAAKLNPKPQTVFYRLGVVYEKAGKYEEAVEAFRKALAKMSTD